MNISKSLAQDAERLTELTLRSKSFWNYDSQQIEAWREELTITKKYCRQHHVYKLTEKNVVIGFYAFRKKNSKNVSLDFLFIEPVFIGKGYGKILLNDFLNRIENGSCKKVLVVADPNAENFYAKFGFKVIDSLKSSIKNRRLPIMVLRL